MSPVCSLVGCKHVGFVSMFCEICATVGQHRLRRVTSSTRAERAIKIRFLSVCTSYLIAYELVSGTDIGRVTFSLSLSKSGHGYAAISNYYSLIDVLGFRYKLPTKPLVPSFTWIAAGR